MYSNANQSEFCVAAVSSMTVAIRAQKALMAVGVQGEVISLPPHATKRGCGWGVEFPAASELTARSTLRTAKIPVSQYIRKGGNGH